MSKYGWDDEPIETNPDVADTVENTVNTVDDRATPKIEIEEILNVPEEAINKDYKVLKETEAVEEKNRDSRSNSRVFETNLQTHPTNRKSICRYTS